MEEIVSLIKKKDEDAVVVEIDHENDLVTIDSTFQIESDEIYEVQEPTLMLEDEMDAPMTNVIVQIVYALFLTNAVVAFIAITLGIAPYLLLKTVSYQNALYILYGLLATNVVIYFIMVWLKSKPVIVIWVVSLSMLLGAIGAIINDFAPLQIATIVFMQSISIVLYTLISPKKIKTWVSMVIMMFIGVATWSLGLYAFIKQQDWISAGVVFALQVIFAVYSTIQVKYADRYSLSDNHMTQAIANFYSDPIYFTFCCESLKY